MATKKVPELRQFDCDQCTGRGYVATRDGYVKCNAPGCNFGQVDKVVWVIVHDDKVETK